METSIRPQEKYTPEYCSGQACNSQHSTAHLCDKTGAIYILWLAVIQQMQPSPTSQLPLPEEKGPLKDVVHNVMALKEQFGEYASYLSC